MRPLSSSGVLDLWETGAGLHPLDRALVALSLADPSSIGSAADWPLGRRNRALLELHAAWFGAELRAWTSCPACGENVEFDLDARQLAATAEETPDSVMVHEHAFRLPSSRDLAFVVSAGDAHAAAISLLEHCRISGPELGGWTDERLDAVGERLASADALAEMRLALTCPSCAHDWYDAIDIGRFLWAEIEARARRLLWDVHALAQAYGWTESETLALGAARRAAYLEMVRA